nr:MAG TPA: hypothetical protein [Caudoviricetes sp.]
MRAWFFIALIKLCKHIIATIIVIVNISSTVFVDFTFFTKHPLSSWSFFI